MQAAINVLIDLVKRKESGELHMIVIAIFGVVTYLHTCIYTGCFVVMYVV